MAEEYNYIEELLIEVENALIDDTPEQAAEALEQLAQTWASAGLTYQSFLDMRQHLVQQASTKTSAYFIKEKLQLAEQHQRKVRNERNDISTNRIHH